MDYSEIKVPFLDKNAIEKGADQFRKKYWDNSLPIDIEKIINFKLGIKIIPTPNLWKFCDVNAQISFNCQWIYVDNDLYKDSRQQNRLRFSFAHEMGHYILHKNIYKGFKLNNVYDFKQVILEKISDRQYGFLETQANKFAGYLLVPRQRLAVEKNKLLDQFKGDSEFIKITDNKLQNSYLAMPLAAIFGVSAEAIEIVLKDESGD